MEGHELVVLEQLCIERKGEQPFRLDIPFLRIQGGDMVVITGKSGSGKTTLMNLLGLALPPKRLSPKAVPSFMLHFGKQKRNCLHFNGFEKIAIRRKYMGYITQSGGLLPYLSVRRNVRLSEELIGQGASGEGSELLDFFDVLDVARKKPSRISGGQYQRAVIAMALAGRPTLILADEPTSSLDPENRRLVLEKLKEQAERHRALVIVTHDLSILLDKKVTKHIDLSASAARNHSVVEVVEMIREDGNNAITATAVANQSSLRVTATISENRLEGALRVRLLDDESLAVIDSRPLRDARRSGNTVELELILDERFENLLDQGRNVFVRVEFKGSYAQNATWRTSNWEPIHVSQPEEIHLPSSDERFSSGVQPEGGTPDWQQAQLELQNVQSWLETAQEGIVGFLRKLPRLLLASQTSEKAPCTEKAPAALQDQVQGDEVLTEHDPAVSNANVPSQDGHEETKLRTLAGDDLYQAATVPNPNDEALHATAPDSALKPVSQISLFPPPRIIERRRQMEGMVDPGCTGKHESQARGDYFLFHASVQNDINILVNSGIHHIFVDFIFQINRHEAHLVNGEICCWRFFSTDNYLLYGFLNRRQELCILGLDQA